MADIELVIKIPEEDYLTFSKLSEKEKINELSKKALDMAKEQWELVRKAREQLANS